VTDLYNLKLFQKAFALRMALALRVGHTDQAWINLRAVTVLATQYEPGPLEQAQLFRTMLVRQAFATTWEALQTNVWTDRQLAELMTHWSHVEFFRGTPAAAELETAQMLAKVAALRVLYRTNSVVSSELLPLLRQARSRPGEAWERLKDLTSRAAIERDYLQRISYLDEVRFIQFYRERELEWRRAVALPNWLAMRSSPGVTNPAVFQHTTDWGSEIQSVVTQRLWSQAFEFSVSGGGWPTLIAHNAEAEASRRVLLTALAVERVRLRTGRMPATLAEVPGAEADFVTGTPLHYRPETGGYVIYSVGLDTEDDEGKMLPSHRDLSEPSQLKFDLVWPRAATAEEIARMPKLRSY
jgi:hypothetical protein